MKKNCFILSLFLLLLSFCLVFSIISCDISPTDIQRQRGFDIYFDNYYDWCMRLNRADFDIEEGVNGCNILIDNKTGESLWSVKNTDTYYLGSGSVVGISEWIKWQSKEGMLLHPYINNAKIKEDFDGKFKIYIFSDKYIYILFNDNNNTIIRFATFYGDWSYDKGNDKWTYDKSLWEKDEKDDEFSYSCWLRKLGDSFTSFLTGCSDSNRARITIKKLENTDSDNVFGYTLNIQGKNIIDCKMHNYKYESSFEEEIYSKNFECLNELEKHSWAPYISQLKDFLNNDDKFTVYLSCLDYIFPTFKPLQYILNMDYNLMPDYIDKALRYGMSIKEINEDNKTITINILDEDNCAFADYFTYIHADDISQRVIKYYKIIDGVPQVVKAINGYILTNADKKNHI